MENKNKPKDSKMVSSIHIVGVIWKKINLELNLTPHVKEFPCELKANCRTNVYR